MKHNVPIAAKSAMKRNFHRNSDIFIAERIILEGSSEMGILPKDARDICESFGGKIATNIKENQKHLEEEILKNCDIKSSFCPKFCIWEDLNEKREDLEFQMNQGVLMTQPIHLGDMLHLKLEIEPNTVEVFQISDSILEDIPANNIQNVILQLAIHNDYNNGIDTKPEYKMVTVGRGTIKKLEKAFEVSQVTKFNTYFFFRISAVKDLAEPSKIAIPSRINGTVELKLEFTKGQVLKISSPELFGNNNSREMQIGKPNGRMYFKKFYEKVKILNAYLTRGSCSKNDFHYFPKNETGGFVNCFQTLPSKSIPVYSCRKASYVACDVISAIPTTTELPATRKIRKNTSTVESETVENAETSSNEHIMFFVSLSGISVAMLVGSLVLQIMKMWQNRKLMVAKKKKNK
ncbi:hypothetical protein GCK72_013777 [Caenorhabditis remanei]|uniref:Uncharacterized protein n=1 Tax=Caenorhabditis remanei TaxID=31234 RepID=A0A6A5GSJ0_CAERE|nr:hypothetical protein GCK72_013777 [Caenorhabditis remanei]KAF1757322.1 hypothetical protein GCK72_013777 [Caenorhabditis remanei]